MFIAHKGVRVKSLFIITLLFLVGCGKGSNDQSEKSLYKLTNSTCLPLDNVSLLAKSTQLFADDTPTIIKITQDLTPYRTCKYTAVATIRASSGVATTSGLSV